MKKIVYLSVDEMNQKLKYFKKYKHIIFGSKDPKDTYKNNAYIKDNRVELSVIAKIGGTVFEYKCRKDTTAMNKQLTGADAYRILSQYYKIDKLDVNKINGSAKPLLYYNKRYNKTRHNAYGYDLNSAYSWGMLQTMPDTTKVVGRYRKVKNGELGFKTVVSISASTGIESLDLQLVESGKTADIIFKEVESPFKRFVEVWYNRKKNAKDLKEKAKAKGVLNYAVGFLQRKNPYIRAAIITRCNKLISSLMDENTLYCNTDSLVSLTRRPEIEEKLGLGVGEWKIEHEGEFAYNGFAYQWNSDIPSYRGIPKSWFPKNYDILKDGVPTFGNVYKFDSEKILLVKVVNNEKENN